MTDLTQADETHLRAALALAHEALKEGNPPFGAVIAAADGTIITVAGNSTSAELNAIRIAGRSALAGTLAGATPYASTEPCAMCAAAAHIAGIGRIVFAFPGGQLRPLYGQKLPFRSLAMGSRTIAAAGGNAMLIAGPHLGDLSAAPHQRMLERL